MVLSRPIFFSTVLLIIIASTGVFAQDAEPNWLANFNSKAFAILFHDLSYGSIFVEPHGAVRIPLIIVLLAGGAVFFSFWYGFITIRAFKHGCKAILGRYSKDSDPGEVSHFRALTAALSATLGLGNIAGVAIAIRMGGPGAAFWMCVAAVFGMASKFSCCTLSQMFRQINHNGSISGGPMYYLDRGLATMGGAWVKIGKVLAVSYAIMVMGAAIGGGNMYQVNQTVEAWTRTYNLGVSANWIIGFLMTIFVGAVVLGGIKRIGLVTSRLIPFMVVLYMLAALVVLATNYYALPNALLLILRMAFTDNAVYGGMLGVLIIGVQRATFSNEAGLGSAAIAHAAAKTSEPVREGMVGMMEPFIDTIMVCMMTALVVVVTGVWERPDLVGGNQNLGVTLTLEAFRSVMPWFTYVLTICITLFAYSTIISWGYYGERGWIYLFDHFGKNMGQRTLIIFQVVFVMAIMVGATNTLKDVLNFSDVMILSIAFPNIIGMIILAPKVRVQLKDYWRRFSHT